MATYSNNTTIKIGSPVSIDATGSGTTSYTVPNNCYLDLIYINIWNEGFNFTFYIKNSTNIYLYSYYGNTQQTMLFENSGLRLPAGTIIYMNTSTSKSVRKVLGTLFQNTP